MSQDIKTFLPGQKIRWQKKLFKARDYNEWFKYHSSYAVLDVARAGNVTAGYWLAFACVFPDKDCQELSDYELINLDNYRRAHNIRPFVTSGDSNFGRANVEEKYISNEKELKEAMDSEKEIDVNQLSF